MSRTAHEITELLYQVNISRDVLKGVFEDVMDALNSDEGYIAFEDTNNRLSIIFSEGNYWYLPTDRGLSGRTFISGKPIISGPDDPDFHSTEGSIFSEIIAPIFHKDVVVGIILLDKIRKNNQQRFNAQDITILELYTKKVSEVLEKKKPWAFRDWFISHQKSKHENMVSELMTKLNRYLKNELEEIDGYIALIGNDMKIDKQVKIGATAEFTMITNEPIDQVLISGEPLITEGQMIKYECIVPFPLNGPVIGVIKLESYKQYKFSDSTVKQIRKIIEEVDFDHLSPAVLSSDPDAEFFYRLIHRSIISNFSGKKISQTLEQIAIDTMQLCDTEVRIIFQPMGLTKEIKEKDGVVHTATEEDLRKRFRQELKGTRPRVFPGKEWLRCPIFIDHELVVVIEFKAKSTIDDRFNLPIIEVISVLIHEVIKRYRVIT